MGQDRELRQVQEEMDLALGAQRSWAEPWAIAEERPEMSGRMSLTTMEMLLFLLSSVKRRYTPRALGRELEHEGDRQISSKSAGDQRMHEKAIM